ncbi:ABC transporter substrate-binding protein [Herbaspirillum rubrisubalbicans]|uniref:ABC transporter substrate-binding protein n=1 Tax=Herbaspirillum rubrisubalbicans Os34 TaxID=1235827 RepID=A0A6M3ZSC3_9BURK|nr:ABC transporter substrate-binding protein [Herbaspirillum rubrisubalbicans]QJQ01446.1 ABC transporter substrate-binding protein [Herbaspirillum rubrisubalbicans Os34]
MKKTSQAARTAWTGLLALTLLCPLAVAAQEADNPAYQALRKRLPEQIRKEGQIVAVNHGSFPPYLIAQSTSSVQGASAELAEAVAQIWGVKIAHQSVSGLSAILIGIKSGRYTLAFGPIGDYPERQASVDFIDFVEESVAFAVQKGNPQTIKSIKDTCGKRIAVMGGGSAEKVINQFSTGCVKQGQPSVTVQIYNDQPTALLSVRSDRADGFFSSHAPLKYFVKKTHGQPGQLELAGVGAGNGFGRIYQGAIVPKGSELGPVLLDTMRLLFENGTYERIMKKWELQEHLLKAPGLNLAKESPQ